MLRMDCLLNRVRVWIATVRSMSNVCTLMLTFLVWEHQVGSHDRWSKLWVRLAVEWDWILFALEYIWEVPVQDIHWH